MRIGVDATSWANGRGYGRFAREVMQAIAVLAPDDEFLCFGDARSFAAFPGGAPNLTRIPVAMKESPTLAAAADGNRSPVDMLRLTAAVWRARPAVFFSPTVYTYFPLPPGQRAVVTIHDTIAERFPALTLPSLRARVFWKAKVALAVRQATLVLTVSDYSADSIEQVLGVPRRRLRVALEAPAPAYHPATPAEVAHASQAIGMPPDASWFTYVGGFSPHKRVDTLIEAHARLVRELARPPYLLLVGALTGDVFLGEGERLRALARAAGSERYLIWTGFVADEVLRQLHSGALAACLVSECEGFGLPAVEAAACGAPVIATTESPLPSLLVGGGFFLRPGEVDAVAHAMRTLATNPSQRAAMGAQALARAGALTWQACGRATLNAVYEAAA